MGVCYINKLCATKKNRMKKILTLILMLIAIAGWAQDKKLNNYYVLWPSVNDTVWHYHYTYDNNLNLERIDRKYDTQIWSYHYMHDTLIMRTYIHVEGDTAFIKYNYYSDSIVKLNTYLGDTIRGVYILDELDHIISYEDNYATESYDWDGENCYEKIKNGDITSATYQSWINPFYEENKFFRLWIDGSYDFNEYTYYNGNVYQNIVIESEGDYPLYVERFENNEFLFRLYFDYLGISDIYETTPSSTRVLEVNYYDVMGRKIPKPDKGFYIEQKTTEKGIISTKYFKQ